MPCRQERPFYPVLVGSQRWHVGVVVLPAGPAVAEITGLRRALGDPDLDRIPLHCTLVPPVRIAPDDVGAALGLLRAAAAAHDPFDAVAGPVDSFEPVSPTVHLTVADTGGLGALRAAVFRGPFHRRTHPFVPHLTLLGEADLETITSARKILAHYRRSFTVRTLTLLVEDRNGELPRWRTAADVDLGGVRVLAQGPLALELTAGSVVDPEAAAILDVSVPGTAPADVPATVVTARREGAVVGVAWGGDGDEGRSGPAGIVVRADARGQGIGTHLRREWAFRCVARRRLSG